MQLVRGRLLTQHRAATTTRTRRIGSERRWHTGAATQQQQQQQSGGETTSSEGDGASSRLDRLLKMGPMLYEPIRIPRHPIVLCHGLYGFAVRGPSSFPRFQIHYWGRLLEILRRRLGVKVIVGKVPPTGTIEERAMALHALLQASSSSSSPSRSPPQFNFIGHSMGGLDARYLISNIQPSSYHPISLTTICTPHRGSPFMDWCRANIGVGSGRGTSSEEEEEREGVPFSLKEPLLGRTREQLGYLPNNLLKVLLLNLLDSPAYSNLSTGYLRKRFNPETRDVAGVQYFSVAARTGKLGPMHPLWLPGLLMDRLGAAQEDGHDGLVTVHSARWGAFLGVVDNTDHWEIRGSAAFGHNHLHNHDPLLNRQAKSRWLELNRYIGSWLSNQPSSSSSDPNLSLSNTSSLNSPPNPDLFTIRDQNSLSTRLLAHWIAQKLPRNLLPTSKPSSPLHSSSSSSSSSTVSSSSSHSPLLSSSYPYKNPTRTVHPNFPLDDLDSNTPNSPKKSSFDIEAFYMALCRNLYDNGL